MSVTEKPFSLIQMVLMGLQQLSPYSYYLNDLVIIICIFLLLLAVYKRDSFIAEIAPTLQISLGVLGTLLGIVMGLSLVNESNFEQSIPIFFNQLVAAFITGIIGFLSAFLVKSFSKPKSEPVSSNITPTDIYQILKEIRDQNFEQTTLLSNMLKRLQASQPFLTEFKQTLIAQDEISQHIKQSCTTLQEIAQHTQSIPQTMQQVLQPVPGLRQQLADMQHYLLTFQQLHQQAGETFPFIEKNLDDLMQGMQREIQRNLEILEISLETQLDMAEVALETQLEGFHELQKHFTELASQLRRNTETISEDIELPPTVPPADFKPNTPNYGEILQDRAYTFMDLGRYQEAIDLFEQAIEFNPEEFSLFYNQACCYALQGQVEPAIVALQQAISLNVECREMARTDSDFDNLRYDARVQSLLEIG